MIVAWAIGQAGSLRTPPMGNFCIINLPLIAIVTDGVKFMWFNSPHNGSARYSKFFRGLVGR